MSHVPHRPSISIVCVSAWRQKFIKAMIVIYSNGISVCIARANGWLAAAWLAKRLRNPPPASQNVGQKEHFAAAAGAAVALWSRYGQVQHSFWLTAQPESQLAS